MAAPSVSRFAAPHVNLLGGKVVILVNASCRETTGKYGKRYGRAQDTWAKAVADNGGTCELWRCPPCLEEGARHKGISACFFLKAEVGTLVVEDDAGVDPDDVVMAMQVPAWPPLFSAR